MKIPVLFATVLSLLVAGCTAVLPSPLPLETKPGPVVRNFDITPPAIDPGETAIMTWSVIGADRVIIDPFIGQVSSSGSMEISPYYNSSYTLTAYSAAGVANEARIIKVNADPTCSVVNSSIRWSPSERALYPVTSEPPVITSFTIEPAEIASGETVTLRWDVKGAAAVYISPDVGSMPVTGSTIIAPLSSRQYVLIARNAFDTVSATTQVTVVAK